MAQLAIFQYIGNITNGVTILKRKIFRKIFR